MKKTARKSCFCYDLFTIVLYNKVEYAKAPREPLGCAPLHYAKAGFPMDRSRITPRLYWLISAAVALVGVALRSVCMLTAFDASVGYFNEGFLSLLTRAFYFPAVMIAVGCAALIPKGRLATELNDQSRSPVAYLLGLSLVIFTLGVLLVCYKDRTNDFLTYPMALAILAALYFFVSGKKAGRYTDGLSLLGFLPVIWCVTTAWETYTDQFTAVNSPVKIGLQMGFLGLALILLSELRFRLGKPLPRLAIAFMSIGLFCTLNGSIPVLLGTGIGVLDNTLHVFYASVLLCGGLYGAIALFRFLCPVKEAPSESTVAVTDDAPSTPSADSPNVE